jgi:hypothetical protein
MEVKGILHCHSTYSYDAELSLTELKELFQKNGVQFVCMTEHTDELTKEQAMEFVMECEKFSDSSFIFIPGFEVPYKVNAGGREGALGYKVNAGGREGALGYKVNAGGREGALGYKGAHVLMIGTRAFHDVYAPTIDILKRWTVDAKFVVLAHPVRNEFEVDDELLDEIDALEVWNQQYEGKLVPRARSLRLYETLRRKKPSLVATGGVDFHRSEHFGAPLITLNVPELSESAITEKLKIGVFSVYSHQAIFSGLLPNVEDTIKKYRLKSGLSVTVIVLGKFVNRALSHLGVSLPKSLRRLVRRRV